MSSRLKSAPVSREQRGYSRFWRDVAGDWRDHCTGPVCRHRSTSQKAVYGNKQGKIAFQGHFGDFDVQKVPDLYGFLAEIPVDS
jgi:hypothetical protein